MGETLDPGAGRPVPSAPRVRVFPAPDTGAETAPRPAHGLPEQFTQAAGDVGLRPVAEPGTPPAPPPTASDAFEAIFAALIGHEGGYVNHPADPGGETKFGITKRSYPHLNIGGLTLNDARTIFRRDFFDCLRCGEMPAPLALLVADAAYHCGPRNSARWLQQALGVAADGAVGPVTVAAIGRWRGRGAALCAEVLSRRMTYLTSLGTWPTFGRGWTRRICQLAFQAAELRDL